MNQAEKQIIWILIGTFALLFTIVSAAVAIGGARDQAEADQPNAAEVTSPTTTTEPPSTTTTTISPEDQAKLDRELANAEIRAEIDRNNKKLGVGKYATTTTTTSPVSISGSTRSLSLAESCALFWPDDGTFRSADGWAVCMYGEDTNAYNAWFNAYWDMYERSNP